MVGKHHILFLLTACTLSVLVGESDAQVIRKAGQALTRKIVGESAETAGQKTGQLVIRKSTSELAESTAQNGVRRAAGNSAASGVSRSGQLVVQYGDDAAKAMAKLSPQNSRRLVMMADDIHATGQGNRLMKLIAERGDGDKIMDFLWRNKATIVGGGLLATFVVNPDPFLSSAEAVASEVVQTSGEHIVEPVVEHVAKPVINWLGFFLLAGTLICLGSFFWHRFGWPIGYSAKHAGSASKLSVGEGAGDVK